MPEFQALVSPCLLRFSRSLEVGQKTFYAVAPLPTTGPTLNAPPSCENTICGQFTT